MPHWNQMGRCPRSSEKDYRELRVAYRNNWRTDAERAEARVTLARSVREARQVVDNHRGTQEVAVQQMLGKLVVQSELADDSLKHPETLRG
jgi:hypothetical protein